MPTAAASPQSPWRRAWRRFRGNRLGYRSLQAFLVLTGSTRREELARYPYSPTRTLESIADLVAPA